MGKGEVTEAVISHSVMSDSLQPCGLQPTSILYPWDFLRRILGVGCHFLFQGIFPTPGLILHLLCFLYYKRILYLLSYSRSPAEVDWWLFFYLHRFFTILNKTLMKIFEMNSVYSLLFPQNKLPDCKHQMKGTEKSSFDGHC